MKVTKKVHNEMAAIRRDRSAAKAQTKASAAKKTPVRKSAKKSAAVKAAPKTPAPRRAPKQTERDPRLPAVGQKLTRTYKGKEVIVEVTADGFRYDGDHYASLSSLAKHIVGYGVSGFAFFGMWKPAVAEAK